MFADSQAACFFADIYIIQKSQRTAYTCKKKLYDFVSSVFSVNLSSLCLTMCSPRVPPIHIQLVG